MRLILAFTFVAMGIAAESTAQKTAGTLKPSFETLNFADTAHYYEKMAEFGLIVGFTRCNGDISNDDYFKSKNNLTPAGGIFYRQPLSPSFALRGNLLVSQLKDDDRFYNSPEWRRERNFSFETFLTSVTLRAEWDIFGKWRFRRTVDTTIYTLDKHTQYALVNGFKRTISPYLFIGGGGVASSAKAKMSFREPGSGQRSSEIAEDLKNAKGLSVTPTVSFGGGLHFDITPRLVLGAELEANLPFTDYLDGISLAGNPEKRDWFWFGGLTLGFRLGANDGDRDGIADKNDKCPDIPGPGMTDGCPDIDHDGVADREDDCPHKAGIRALAGCPVKDADEDGVPDIDDYCPDIAGLSQFKGCPDTDSDGIEDRADSCKTLAGLAQFNGCPDTDGDGIQDNMDACPTEKGPAEYYYGCPVRDTDGDGIEDKLDACLLVKGTEAFKGCPDSDNDGVEDKMDPCPNIPGPKENRGCPMVAKKDKEKLELAVKAVKFETGKAVLKLESSKILTDIADMLTRYPHYNLRIEGHTDSQGKDDANMLLSEKRAQACADFLIAKGISKSRFLVKGFGETKPVSDNKTAAGKTKNRRVEFDLVFPD